MLCSFTTIGQNYFNNIELHFKIIYCSKFIYYNYAFRLSYENLHYNF